MKRGDMIGRKLFLILSIFAPAGIILAGLAILVALLVCGFNPNQRLLVGGYYLDPSEDVPHVYYVGAPGMAINGGGVFDGTIQRIGWNASWILAKVIRLYQGDTNGWYALNLKTGKVTGPLAGNQLRRDLRDWRIKPASPASLFGRHRPGWAHSVPIRLK